MRLSLLLLLFISSFRLCAQDVTISGIVRDTKDKSVLPYVNVTLHDATDSSFVAGGITDESGGFSLAQLKSGEYTLKVTYVGYATKFQSVLIGELSKYLDLGNIELLSDSKQLSEVVVTAKQEAVPDKMDKKVFSLQDNISQTGSSVLEAMKNLPGVTTNNDGKLQLRGSDKVMVLIDGKQTALTGFSNQSSLDNIPASAIERIEIINNPSSKYDANGNAGIINIIYKKQKQEGFNGKVGLTTGLGALWIKEQNFPSISSQYQRTPKINPSLSLNYKKDKINLYLQADNNYNRTLNKNEFVDRYYENGAIVRQQTKRNRTTNVITGQAGMDWSYNDNNMLAISGLFSSEKILDRGDEPFFNNDLSTRHRLWQFIEDELKTTATVSAMYRHKFKQLGRTLNIGFNYTYHRENEQYFFTNILPAYTGLDSFKLLSDEHVSDLTIDYVQPLRYGRIEGGLKFRRRNIPVNMQFIAGLNSPLDTNAGGWANYGEIIPAVYGNYVYEGKLFDVEAGLRVEYVNVDYQVNPNHNTYKSDGYSYTQPFPNLRLGYKLNDRQKLSLFYNRRVDRPNEVDIRIFPKYDDAEIVKVGNPSLRPQFTNTIELGYKMSWEKSYLYSALYHKIMDATITRIASIVPASNIIYNIFQNAGRSYNTGIELLYSQDVSKLLSLNINLNGYKNTIDAFTVINQYPEQNVFFAAKQDILSGSFKLNTMFHLPWKLDAQLTAIYLAPDVIPQGKIDARYSVDLGFKKKIQRGKGELYLNCSDIANTMRIRRSVQGDGFRYVATDYYETQVVRVGYNYKF